MSEFLTGTPKRRSINDIMVPFSIFCYSDLFSLMSFTILKSFFCRTVIALGILFFVVVSAYEFQTIYNPFSGRLDYHVTSNFTNYNVTANYYCNSTDCYLIDSFISMVGGNCSIGGSCVNITYLDYDNQGNLNISGNYTGNEYRNLTGDIEWIKPEHIFDVDDADVETDLNTYVDIPGDIMTGNLTTLNLTVESTISSTQHKTYLEFTDKGEMILWFSRS